MECPFCGQTLIKTDYQRIQKLLNEPETPRGKACQKCGGVAILNLNSQAKEIILGKLAKDAGPMKIVPPKEGGEQ